MEHLFIAAPVTASNPVDDEYLAPAFQSYSLLRADGLFGPLDAPEEIVTGEGRGIRNVITGVWYYQARWTRRP